MTEELNAGEEAPLSFPPPSTPSTPADPVLRKYAIGISLLLIAYGVASVMIGMGVLAFMSMDTAFRPEPCLPFVITPVLVLLVPCLIGLLRLKQWGIYITVFYLAIFGVLPGFTVLDGAWGVVAGLLPFAIAVFLISRNHQFAK